MIPPLVIMQSPVIMQKLVIMQSSVIMHKPVIMQVSRHGPPFGFPRAGSPDGARRARIRP